MGQKTPALSVDEITSGRLQRGDEVEVWFNINSDCGEYVVELLMGYLREARGHCWLIAEIASSPYLGSQFGQRDRVESIIVHTSVLPES